MAHMGLIRNWTLSQTGLRRPGPDLRIIESILERCAPKLKSCFDARAPRPAYDQMEKARAMFYLEILAAYL